MSLTSIGTSMQFAAHKLALNYAKENLPQAEYQKIKNSYDRIFKKSILFICIVCLPVIIACTLVIIEAPFSKAVSNQVSDKYIDARVDYDGNFYWTSDSRVYEYPLVNYGLAADNYEFGDKVRVYLDESNGVIDVTPVPEYNARLIEMIAALVCLFVVPTILIVCIHLPIAKRTYGKPWYNFYKSI